MLGPFSVRIAACLNACQHLTDAELSHGPVAGAAQRSQLVDRAQAAEGDVVARIAEAVRLRGTISRLCADHKALRNDRDALLAALRDLIGCADPNRDRKELKAARAALGGR